MNISLGNMSDDEIIQPFCFFEIFMNDPAAGSPTATLLRLLPCQDPKYRYTLQQVRVAPYCHSVKLYLGPFRGSDGRCVQEPGTYSLRPDETRIQDIPRSWRIITSINPHHDSGSKDSPSPSTQAAIRKSCPFGHRSSLAESV